jgi:hypothetical protein
MAMTGMPLTVKIVTGRARATDDVGATLRDAQRTAKEPASAREGLLRPGVRASLSVGPERVIKGA